jgi:hypothetical protein
MHEFEPSEKIMYNEKIKDSLLWICPLL